MEAIRVHPNSDKSNPYSVSNPAPSSALVLDSGLPIPKPRNAGDLLIQIEATTVIRDSLTWPETYDEEYKISGNDFAGTVIAINEPSGESHFKPGDEVYGMAEASRAGTWAQYAIIPATEAGRKPKSLSWAEAAAVPLSGLTAYEALFEQAGVRLPDFDNLHELRNESIPKKAANNVPTVLITGANGGVGLYLVQLARLAGQHVVAATRSNSRHRDILTRLGADEVVEYNELSKDQKRFDIIIDTIGGKVLEGCWSLAKENGTLVSVDSSSYNFVEEHKNAGVNRGSENVKALFFVVSPSQKALEHLSAALDAKVLEPFVAKVMPLAEAREAYELSSSTMTARGKIVLLPGPSSTSG